MLVSFLPPFHLSNTLNYSYTYAHSIFYQYTPFPAIGFWWLPITALFILAVSLYVDTDLRKLTRDIDLLEKMKYEYKKV